VVLELHLKQILKTILVRGKYTQKRYNELGYEYSKNIGDPGLIVPLFFNPSVNKLYKIGYTPHIIDFEIVENMFKHDKTKIVIDLRCGDNVESVIEKMLSCEYIVSSSLHGLVIAHAYNIQCIWCSSINKLCGDNVKFYDYYSVFNLDEKIHPCKYEDVTEFDIKDYPNPTKAEVIVVQNNILNALSCLKESVECGNL
jgi:pyruvyltransferase